jgi:hypothetical protein
LTYGLKGQLASILEPIIYKKMVPYIVNQLEAWGADGFRQAAKANISLLERMKTHDPKAWKQLQIAKKYFTVEAWDQTRLEGHIFIKIQERGIPIYKEEWVYVQGQISLLREELSKK